MKYSPYICARTSPVVFSLRVRDGSCLRRMRFLTLLFALPGFHFGFPQTIKPHDSGATYYVDSTAGDDNYGGTLSGTPWRTLSKLNATTFSPGVRILFKSGATWTGQLWPKGSGTERHPIVIDKYGGEAKPIINGNGEAEGAVLLKNQEDWEIRNLEVTNTGT